jgi:hypothetical protein
MARRFSVDPERVDRIVAAGDAAADARRKAQEEESDVARRLALQKVKRNEAANEGRVRYYAVTESGQKLFEPSPYDAAIAKLEAELARVKRRRSETDARLEHDVRLGNLVRDYRGDRTPRPDDYQEARTWPRT